MIFRKSRLWKMIIRSSARELIARGHAGLHRDELGRPRAFQEGRPHIHFSDHSIRFNGYGRAGFINAMGEARL